MPISSIDNQRRTIGVYYHLERKKCKTRVKIDLAYSQFPLLEEGESIRKLAHVSNRVHSDRKNDKIITKQMQVASLLPVAIILLALKPHYGVHNEKLSSEKTMLLSSLSRLNNSLNNEVPYGNISLIDIIPLHKPHVTGKNTADPSCEIAKAGKLKKRKRARDNARHKAEASGHSTPSVAPSTATSVKATGVTTAPFMGMGVIKASSHGSAVPPAAGDIIGEAAIADGGDAPKRSESFPIHNAHNYYIPKLAQFINPMKYHQLQFGDKKSDTYEAIKRKIKSNYRTEDVCICYLKNTGNDVPDQFFYLKNNFNVFRMEINKVRGMVNKVLLKFNRTTKRNDFGCLEYHSQNSIKGHLQRILDTDDSTIVHQAMLRLEFYLSQLVKFFREDMGNIIFATSNVKNAPGIPFQEPMLGFTMPMDSGNRIVIMVDYFDRDIILNDRLKITSLVENSSIQIGARSFIFSPKGRQAGDVNQILEVFDEDMFAQGKEVFMFDDLFIKSYENFLDVKVVDAVQLIQVIKNNPLLQKNIMMDNAHFMAKIIYDIAHDKADEHYSIFPVVNNINADEGLGQMFTKAILNLIIKQKGVA
ncbi:hypothetical protein [Sodalis sp. dw_96]|uniref:hypothetical protein n=1 Tax=Sodalis sp. dw_96 TaxID=2719794 RepID=UPI001BD413B5|nr:hypothetical protein [Sodalis sp. dw_96]